MKTLSGVSRSTFTKFLQFEFGEKFYHCELKGARREFHIMVSDEVSKEEEQRWVDFWQDKGITLKFLRFQEPTEDV